MSRLFLLVVETLGTAGQVESVNSLECGGPAPLWPAPAKHSTMAGQIGQSDQSAAKPAHSQELTLPLRPLEGRSLAADAHLLRFAGGATKVARLQVIFEHHKHFPFVAVRILHPCFVLRRVATVGLHFITSD